MEKEKRTVTLGAGSMERHGIDPDNNPNKVYIDTDEGAEKGHKLMDELKTAIRMRPDNIIIEGSQAADPEKGKAEGDGPTRARHYFDTETFQMVNPVDMKEEIKADKNGEGYILLLFREGLEKNEGDVTKTIGELGLEWADVLKDIRMRHGLETAMAERLGGKCAVEILDSKGKHGNPEQGEEPAAPKRRLR